MVVARVEHDGHERRGDRPVLLIALLLANEPPLKRSGVASTHLGGLELAAPA